jgi:hypothetical protein
MDMNGGPSDRVESDSTFIQFIDRIGRGVRWIFEILLFRIIVIGIIASFFRMIGRGVRVLAEWVIQQVSRRRGKALEDRPRFFGLYTSLTLVLSAVSAAATYVGLMMTGSGQKMAVAIAIGGAFAIFAIDYVLGYYFPRSNLWYKILLLGAAVVTVPFIWGFSTQFSILTVGGAEAMNIHRERTITGAALEARKLLEQGQAEANMAPQLNELAANFDSLASREVHAEFTGMSGAGAVYSNLKSAAQNLRSMAVNVHTVDSLRNEYNDKITAELNAMRRLQLQAERLGEREVNVRFAAHLQRVNELLVKMAGQTSIPFIKAINASLQGLGSGNSNQLDPRQTAAIQRLGSTVRSAQMVVRELTPRQGANSKMQVFEMITPTAAVYRYAREVPYAIAFGVGFDYLPFLLVVIITMGESSHLAWARRKRIREQKEALASEKAAQELEEARRERQRKAAQHQADMRAQGYVPEADAPLVGEIVEV